MMWLARNRSDAGSDLAEDQSGTCGKNKAGTNSFIKWVSNCTERFEETQLYRYFYVDRYCAGP